MIVVIKIHNSKVVSCFEVKSLSEGIDEIKIAAEEQLERELTLDEIDTLDNDMEVYSDEDPDNHYTWTVTEVKKL